MILAAGFGSRMKDLTEKIPKPLFKIKNTTLLSNTINFFENIAGTITTVLLLADILVETEVNGRSPGEDIPLTKEITETFPDWKGRGGSEHQKKATRIIRRGRQREKAKPAVRIPDVIMLRAKVIMTLPGFIGMANTHYS